MTYSDWWEVAHNRPRSSLASWLASALRKTLSAADDCVRVSLGQPSRPALHKVYRTNHAL